jgi:HEAT repeat protein
LIWTAGAVAGDGPPTSNATSVLDDYGKQLQDQSRPESERLKIIELFGQWATPQIRAPLVAALADPSPSIREAAARALGWPGNREAVPALLERLQAPDETTAVKAAALQALGLIGDDSARGLVITASQDADAKVREPALYGLALGGLVRPSDRPVFLRTLAADQALDLLMRTQSIQALGELKDVGSAEVLMRLLENEPPTRLKAIENSAAQPQIMMTRYWEMRDVRAWSARSIEQIDARAALPLLLKTAEDPDDFFLRLLSVRVLVEWAAPEARPVFIRRLDDPYSGTRAAALAGLGRLKDPSVVDSVLARLSDTAPTVRVQAVVALAELGDPRVLPQLEALQISDPSPLVQEVAGKALSSLRR